MRSLISQLSNKYIHEQGQPIRPNYILFTLFLYQSIVYVHVNNDIFARITAV